ncbi:hypothetical protein LPTSP2_38660 [Leptospira ellinghausenii]|uniref:Uncharacterized protein n=1 Tax=Leptospira ellinghausenii TaxID=1917822 RepID=A0A2P2DIS6_9LEPT|nr:hypothetical protein [Leptospira ellinghausenii]GBF44563.1 hypothetical protein LPTSP2_38660 [Leptospira ellinghausenii]
MTKPIKKVSKKISVVKTEKIKKLTYDKTKSINPEASDDGVVTYKISRELMQSIIDLRDDFSLEIANDYKGTYIEFLTEYFVNCTSSPEHFRNIDRLALLHEMLTATNTTDWFNNAYFGQYEYYYSYIADKKENQIEQHILFEKLKASFN